MGVGRATTRNTRGLTRSVIRLIVPPLPAVSRPSNTMQIFAPDFLTHSCIATSSAWRDLMCSSYSFFFIFPGAPSACPSACPSARPSGWYPGVGSVPALWFFLAIPVIPL